MIEQVLVCPPEERLLDRLRRRAVVIRLDDPARMPALASRVQRDNHLHAFWLSWPEAVSALPADGWPSAPVVVYADTLGPVRDLVRVLPLLRRSGISVLLTSDHEENFVGASLLASLRVHAGIFFGRRPISWDRLGTLMHHAVYSRASHAPVEPFEYILSRYDPASYTSPGGAYFDDPRRFLHLDAEGRIALSPDDLRAGVFAAGSLEQLDDTPALPAYRERMRAWHQVFLGRETCAYCPSWRICLGAFKAERAEGRGCEDFFSELLDAADWRRQLHAGNGGAPWP